MSRRKKADPIVEEAPAVQAVAGNEAEPDGPATSGPWDSAAKPNRGDRLDLGSLWVPVQQGRTVRLEVERATGRPVAVNVARDGSNVQIQAFAAPRTAGVWDEIRSELVASIEAKGGTVAEQDGPFGLELRAKVPAQTADGRIGKRAVRFLGVDGPRWFLRAVLSGKAATNPEAAAKLEAVFADVVVNRGGDAHPPRDLLSLTPPGASPAGGADGAEPSDLAMPQRGPEITEIH
jgi:hypothetical protein